jgi:isochorismate hydrolase
LTTLSASLAADTLVVGGVAGFMGDIVAADCCVDTDFGSFCVCADALSWFVKIEHQSCLGEAIAHPVLL